MPAIEGMPPELNRAFSAGGCRAGIYSGALPQPGGECSAFSAQHLVSSNEAHA